MANRPKPVPTTVHLDDVSQEEISRIKNDSDDLVLRREIAVIGNGVAQLNRDLSERVGEVAAHLESISESENRSAWMLERCALALELLAINYASDRTTPDLRAAAAKLAVRIAHREESKLAIVDMQAEEER